MSRAGISLREEGSPPGGVAPALGSRDKSARVGEIGWIYAAAPLVASLFLCSSEEAGGAFVALVRLLCWEVYVGGGRDESGWWKRVQELAGGRF